MPTESFSACENAWHEWEETVVAVVVLSAAIVAALPVGTCRQYRGTTTIRGQGVIHGGNECRVVNVFVSFTVKIRIFIFFCNQLVR